MFGKLNDLLNNAQSMKEQMEKIEVTAEAGAGEVKVVMNARHFVKKVQLSNEILEESKEVIEELIAAAMNEASRKIEKEAQSQMMDMSGILGSFMDKDK